MRTSIFTLLLLTGSLLTYLQVDAQRYITKNGYVSFYSDTPLETILSTNNQVNCALDVSTGDMVFKVLMKSFTFEKALMQEHFNETSVESDKYPNCIFQGEVANLDQVDFSKPGTYDAIVEGDLTLHGITHHISEKGTFTVEDDVIKGHSVFNLVPADYKITVPKTVIRNIADVVEVTIDVELHKL